MIRVHFYLRHASRQVLCQISSSIVVVGTSLYFYSVFIPGQYFADALPVFVGVLGLKRLDNGEISEAAWIMKHVSEVQNKTQYKIGIQFYSTIDWVLKLQYLVCVLWMITMRCEIKFFGFNCTSVAAALMNVDFYSESTVDFFCHLVGCVLNDKQALCRRKTKTTNGSEQWDLSFCCGKLQSFFTISLPGRFYFILCIYYLIQK